MYLFKYGKRLQNVMILAGAAVVVLLAVFAAALFDTRLQGNDAGAAKRLENGWIYESEGEWRLLPQLPCTLAWEGESLVLRRELANVDVPEEYCFVFQTRYSSIRVWAGERLIYEAAGGKEHALGSMWHFIPVADMQGEKQITVEFRRYATEREWELKSVMLDHPAAALYEILLSYMPQILFGMFCFMLAGLLLVFSLITAYRKRSMAVPQISLAFFMLLSGLWILLDTKVTTLWGGNYAISYFLSYAAFYLMCVPFLVFVRSMVKSENRLLGILIWIFIANAGVCFVLHMTGLAQLNDTVPAVHILIILAMIVSTAEFWSSIVRKRRQRMSFTFAGMLAVYFFGLLSLAFSSFWKERDDFSFYRSLAMRDDMTGLGNRNAFQLCQSYLAGQAPGRLDVLLFDVDNLKRTNDLLGHHTGDMLLQTMAKGIYAVFSSMGECFRIGGDEFCVVIVEKTASRVSEAVEVFEKEAKRLLRYFPEYANVSYGHALWENTAEEKLTPERLALLIEEADRNMYQMKHTHRE
ncbi:diguanylate cyclase domain-containing protein [Candidatus Acetatifactor stercoripullorum]|uniref:diguanylate cyclase domain-containing protein n=1 Tax=Candidatus Acetatifactor stercoripullorum TaxID=2838414 RepID=UPI00298E8835|nr:diguanylate cyclase [Candidatus Acetatifactor stercoripullorum]